MPTEIIAVERKRKYRWPEAQLNIWMLVMIAGSSCQLGFFVYFMTVQSQMGLGIPWLFPFQVTVASISLAFLCLMLWLISQRQLLPGVVLLGSFILFVLWLTGLVEVCVQMFGPSNGVHQSCQLYVQNQPFTGVSVGTLAWLEQTNICNVWDAAFSFVLVGVIFLMWMMLMAYQVNNDEYD